MAAARTPCIRADNAVGRQIMLPLPCLRCLDRLRPESCVLCNTDLLPEDNVGTR